MGNPKNNTGKLDPEVVEKLQLQAGELKNMVDAGDYASAMRLINDLNEVRDQSLYREVGRLTRSLHEAIRNFQIDPQNAEQQEALSKMSDASDRLTYVVQMTGNAANRTMDLVEEAMPKANAMREQAQAIREEWHKLRRREIGPSEFRELYQRIDNFFEHTANDAELLYGHLSEILLAQDFQDLTGQVIQKVTTLVKEVEEHLLSLVVMASHVDQITGTVHELGEIKESIEKGEGPQMRAQEREDVVSGQDDVDDLLSSLGF
ncbi:protein phosphatase CheZ [Marinobacter nanhaiticus D15-8W]|uniref:Protein phosphatase CheZ n=1 Tax=Marinobacter nanhaiticus D15-8W TaxID=626887 RepID=N6WZQ0_9GAMM|nr:protein phosphatase CheZ [Marinobacter nanhaiticus]ENO17051.1 protein phosphatase CheZ [Marinobacter nanhaiticus D15-8W]BES71953.1 protein phosphatase CheZ [Marinobacter nanhaiticus D15-8W]